MPDDQNGPVVQIHYGNVHLLADQVRDGRLEKEAALRMLRHALFGSNGGTSLKINRAINDIEALL